ncbi:DUF469 family protein [Parashewanella spongiae]|uniref:DUF469 family protein n=1 Tax=Parashewanella spongiae TaxID=342950 RepID=A0A3A6TPH9_9GAMM|nr:50S ribosome-binding protein YggL [Parashewanella spongiae]MCL1079684.1 YggL family protein [Parashewanella spongiae]RJY07045.1 DUF469 family protein [Parashewanella spongiae]
MVLKLNAKRNRRLRKKLFVDEYSVYGQKFKVKLVDNEEQEDNFLDDFCDLLGSMNMYCAGGNGGFLVCSHGRYDLPSVQQMERIQVLLEQHSAVIELGEFKPLNLHYPD